MTLSMYTSTSYKPLPFKIPHTNIVHLLISQSPVQPQQGQDNISVYMILNSKCCLTGCGLQSSFHFF